MKTHPDMFGHTGSSKETLCPTICFLLPCVIFLSLLGKQFNFPVFPGMWKNLSSSTLGILPNLLSSILSTMLKQMKDKTLHQRALPTYKPKRRYGFQEHYKHTWKFPIECVYGRVKTKILSKSFIAIISKTSKEWVWGAFKSHMMDIKRKVEGLFNILCFNSS